MCLAYAQPDLEPLLTRPLLEAAIAFVESNEDNLEKLTVAAGRNPLAAVQHKVLSWLKDAPNQWILEATWHTQCSQEMTEFEYDSICRMLKSTQQIVFTVFPVFGKNEAIVCTMARYKEMKEKGEVT